MANKIAVTGGIVLFLTVVIPGFYLHAQAQSDAATLLTQANAMKSKDCQRAEAIYRSIVENYPGSNEAFSAQKSLALICIIATRYPQAQTEVDALIAGFANHPQLAAGLYDIAEQYWSRYNYLLAKRLYKYIADNRPDSPLAITAQGWVAGCDFMTGSDESAWKEINTLTERFTGHPDLAQRIYDVAGSCWLHKKYSQAQKLYQYIIDKLPQSNLRFRSRVWVVGAEIPLGNYAAAEEGLNALIKESPDQPELTGVLYQLANEYWDVKRYADAKRFYEQVLQRAPDHIRARLWTLGADIVQGNYEGADAAIDKIVTDFKDAADLPEQLCKLAEECGIKAVELSDQGLRSEAKLWSQRAIGIWERVIQSFPPAAAHTGRAYFCAAGTYADDSGDYEKALQYYQILLDNWPDFDEVRVPYAYFGIARCYDKLAETGRVPKETATEQIRMACEKILSDRRSDQTVRMLARHWLEILPKQ
jgi:tetratricopeptide (TPR) repeat protein